MADQRSSRDSSSSQEPRRVDRADSVPSAGSVPSAADGAPAPTTDDGPTPATGSRLVPGSTEDDFGAAVAAMTEDNLAPGQRRRLLNELVGYVRERGLGDLFKPRAAIRWLSDAVSDIAPRVPIRDLATLRQHFDGLDGDELAGRLVRNAARTTAAIGAAGGGVAAVEWAVTPALLSAPVLLAAETIAVVAVEFKLVGELHEVYGSPLPTAVGPRTVALVHSWATQRGVNPMVPGAGLGVVLGTAARKELRETLTRRFGRNLTTLGPFLSGAAVAGYLNRRATRALGDRLRADLRRQHRALPAPPSRPELP